MKRLLFAIVFACGLFPLGAESLKVVRSGTSTEISSPFPGGWTMVQTFHTTGPNRQFNFRAVSLKKEGKTMNVGYPGDDACPWNINGTYIGANHGDSIATGLVFPGPHGLTSADCGSRWTDPKGMNFYLMKIESPTVVWMLSENISKDKDIWNFVRSGKVELKNAETGKILKGFTPEMRQLYSPVRITKRTYLADGRPLGEKETAECSVFTVEEEYDIAATDSVLEHVIRNKGRQVEFNAPGIDKVLSQKIIYSFRPDGSCIVTHNSKFFRDAMLGYMGFLQAGQLAKGAYAKHLYYIPKTLPFQFGGRTWDFAGTEDYTKPIAGTMLLDSKTFENPASMPERFLQYLSGGNGLPEIGFAVGYSLTEGCTVPAEHLKNASQALFLYKSHKTYPHAIDGGKIRRIKAGQTFFCMAYRQYFDPSKGYYINRQGKNLILYADFHAPIRGKAIELPEEVRNLKMSVLEKSGTVSFRKTGNALLFDSTGRYGYAVLKFE